MLCGAWLLASDSSIVLGAVWGLWHLPLFFVPGDAMGSRFSLPMHSAVNQTAGVVPGTLAQPGFAPDSLQVWIRVTNRSPASAR